MFWTLARQYSLHSEFAENRCFYISAKVVFLISSSLLHGSKSFFPGRTAGMGIGKGRDVEWDWLMMKLIVGFHDTQTPDNPKSSSFTRFHSPLARLRPSPPTQEFWKNVTCGQNTAKSCGKNSEKREKHVHGASTQKSLFLPAYSIKRQKWGIYVWRKHKWNSLSACFAPWSGT